MAVVNFNDVVAINKRLKDNNIDYTIHSDSGCTCSGVTLRQEGKVTPRHEILKVINDYLYLHFMEVVEDDKDINKLNVISRFK